MAGSSPHPSTADVVDGTIPVAVGLGIVTMTLFPFAIPVLALTAVALLPLLPLLVIPLAVGLIAAPILLLRRLLRRTA